MQLHCESFKQDLCTGCELQLAPCEVCCRVQKSCASIFSGADIYRDVKICVLSGCVGYF